MAACETNEKAVDADGGDAEEDVKDVFVVLGAQFDSAAINAVPDEDDEADKDDDRDDDWPFINGGAW